VEVRLDDWPIPTLNWQFMRSEARGEVLMITGLSRLTAEEVALFKDLVRATLTDLQCVVEVDLSGTQTMDSEGVGALIAVHKRLRERSGTVRLRHPTPFVAQLLQLLKLDRILEIVP
jgi:anti-sigma B factor antagonist